MATPYGFNDFIAYKAHLVSFSLTILEMGNFGHKNITNIRKQLGIENLPPLLLQIKKEMTSESNFEFKG